MDVIVGKIYSIIFNRDNYYIMHFDALGHRSVKVKGNFYGLVMLGAAVPIKLLGEWAHNKRYGGREFVVRTWEPWSEDTEGCVRFLNTCVNGFVDIKFVEALVERHGFSVFEKLTKERLSILEDPLEGVSRETLEEALIGWERALAHRDLATLLSAGGLVSAEVQMALNWFGTEAAKIVKENPFRLLEIVGISFSKVDRLALSLGCDVKDPRRLQGAILWTIQEASKQGHLFLRRGEMLPMVEVLSQDLAAPLPIGKDVKKNYDAAIVELLRQKAAVLDTDAGIYLPVFYMYERKAAELLSSLLVSSGIEVDLKPFLDAYERTHHIELSSAQRKAVELLAGNNVLVITGLPGTGKTTLLRAIVRLLEEANLTFALMAPTGIAAKRLAAVTGCPASTVHRALNFNGSEWGIDENRRLVVDAVVIDEASMMDQELFYRILSALRPGTRLVLVGDDAQLPSVGPGNVLKELLDCPNVPNVRLTEIFRQAVKGEIVVSSHRINSGKLPDLNQGAESEFRFVRLSEESKIVDLIVDMAARLKSRNANFQVLSPKYEGVVGVDALNKRLQEVLNPEGPKEEIYGSQRFRVGDRLMVIQNDYKLDVYNGDVGKLDGIYPDHLDLRVHNVLNQTSAERIVSFPRDVVESRLRMAYAITAHKSQGSEFDTIIMPIVRTQGRMLQRNLLYTAVTRARKKVWLIGEETAIQRAINNNKVLERNTVLAKAISNCVATGVTPAEALGES